MENKKDFEKGWEEYQAKKKEELEELVGDIAKGLQGVLLCEIIQLAKSLIKQGYRKIEKDDIVVDKQEYENLQIGKDFDYGYHEGYKNTEAYYENFALPQERKETAKYLIDEFATMLVALKVGKVFNKKLDNPISQGAYLFMLENLKRLAQEFSVEIGENK